MADGPPSLIAINHDRFHAKHVGRTSKGNQFFLTTPFLPADPNQKGLEFIALYLLDAAGNLLEARIDNLGPRSELDDDVHRRVYEQHLRELGEVTFERIEFRPFTVERFGIVFGFVPRAPETQDSNWVVEAMPGNFMAFFPPWDSGDYDT